MWHLLNGIFRIPSHLITLPLEKLFKCHNSMRPFHPRHQTLNVGLQTGPRYVAIRAPHRQIDEFTKSGLG